MTFASVWVVVVRSSGAPAPPGAVGAAGAAAPFTSALPAAGAGAAAAGAGGAAPVGGGGGMGPREAAVNARARARQANAVPSIGAQLYTRPRWNPTNALSGCGQASAWSSRTPSAWGC